ncbi:cation-transporting P-type ATPase [Paraburkholderia aromaticivorans]|uniref:cation-transporting P-type ATPase n=1 Tax=Paraburkholderia aromaticivorans TaxID=2026199 RepID=UPI001F10A516|nr:cation-transporting P-type ATPase [Paraburkholderia aromaticivorans]
MPVPIVESARRPDVAIKASLSSTEARRRRAESGTNTLPDTSASTWRMVLEKFWAPVPWMADTAVIWRARALRRSRDCCRTAAIQCRSDVMQESRAQATLAALKSRLAMSASVLRDGTRSIIPAAAGRGQCRQAIARRPWRSAELRRRRCLRC